MSEGTATRFRNADGYTTKGRGHAEGQRIIRDLAKETDVQYDITSTLGKGTTFTLYIPLHKQNPKANKST